MKVDNMKKTGLHGYIYDFSVGYDAIADDDILDIHRYLMKKWYNIKCLDLSKKCLQCKIRPEIVKYYQ